jgi:hypothetical protein
VENIKGPISHSKGLMLQPPLVDNSEVFMPEDSHTNRVVMNPAAEKHLGGTISSSSSLSGDAEEIPSELFNKENGGVYSVMETINEEAAMSHTNVMTGVNSHYKILSPQPIMASEKKVVHN